MFSSRRDGTEGPSAQELIPGVILVGVRGDPDYKVICRVGVDLVSTRGATPQDESCG